MARRDDLRKAQDGKNDEFYTQYEDIEKEMNAYYEYDKDAFRNKTVLCPCDDPEWSNFTKYFVANFNRLGLKKLISTSYAKASSNNIVPEFERTSSKYDIEKHNTHGKVFTVTKKDIKNVDFDDIQFEYLEGDGDFNSDEVKQLRNDSDIIVTNPPFSLFRDFIAWINEADKKFIIIGNLNAITYKEIFPLLMNNKMWIGASIHSGDRKFYVPDDYPLEAAGCGVDENGRKYIRVKGVRWYTNIEHGYRHEKLNLMTMADNIKFNKKATKKFNTDYDGVNYPKYDNYDAIEVPTSDSIPSDYDGIMGVPISFMDKYCPEQFEIVGLGNSRDNFTPNKDYINPKKHLKNGKIANGGAINCVLAISCKNPPEGIVYYTSDNSEYLIPPYARILLKHKKGNN